MFDQNLVYHPGLSTRHPLLAVGTNDYVAPLGEGVKDLDAWSKAGSHHRLQLVIGIVGRRCGCNPRVNRSYECIARAVFAPVVGYFENVRIEYIAEGA